jgi:hypothetical protein
VAEGQSGVTMTVFTPTSKSEMIAGAGFWATCWAFLFHIDDILALVHLERFTSSAQIRGWIATHKTVTLIITEICNMLMHDISSPSGVSVLIGGTMFNMFMIYLYMPLHGLIFGRKHV